MGFVYVQFTIATLLPVAVCMVFWFLRKRTSASSIPNAAWQVIVGVVFGLVAIYASESGLQLGDATISVRDAAPLAAGLLFGGPAGIIAGVIGGVERWFAVAWGAGEFTQLACCLGTIFAGVYAAAMRKFLFDNRIPSWFIAFATGVVTEVVHLVLIFALNSDQAALAIEVVKACSLPMIVCVAASAALCALALALQSGQRIFTPREERGVAQIVQNNLLVAIVTAFFITVGFTSLVQTGLARSDAESLLALNVQDVQRDITEASDANILALARYVAAEFPKVSDASDEDCIRIAKELDVAEVHVVDSEGIIVATNVPANEGFDMASGEQSSEFLALLQGGGKIQLVQEYQPQSYDANVWRKYAGVSIIGGFVQVGYDAANFSDDLDMQVRASIRNRHVGQTGGLWVVDTYDNVITTRENITGLDTEALVNDADAAGAGKLFTTHFGNEECYAMYQQVEGYSIVAFLPTTEANTSGDNAVLIIALMEVLIFAALFMVMYFAIKRVVVRSIWQVGGRLDQISSGNLDVVVDVRETSEFASLSDDINRTVGILKESLEAVQADLDMAADIQANTLPGISADIAGRKSFELHASMEPAKEVGGDFYDFFMVDDDHLALVVADVSGKGVPAALFMMLSKTVIKMESLSGLSPEQVLYRANVDLSEKNDDDMFTTAWLGVLQISTGKLVYADAGHEKLAILRDGTWDLPSKPNGAVALASFPEEDYAELPDRFRFRTYTIWLKPGDAIFQYTDGVTEAIDTDDELFGEERLLEALNDSPNANPKTLLPFVRMRIGDFVGDAPQFDDITMLGLRYLGNEDDANGGDGDNIDAH